MSVDVVLTRHPGGMLDLRPAQSSTCKSCGLCSDASASRFGVASKETTALSLSLPATSLTLIAIGLYGAPLAGLLGGTLLAAALGAGDLGALAGAFAGCIGGSILMKRSSSAMEKSAVERLSLRFSRSMETQ